MKREERRVEILAAVIAVASTDGFAAATIRRIASDLGMATGAIHHIFSSSTEMKREAFRVFVDQSMEWMAAASHGSKIERLLPFLCAPDDPLQAPNVLMWREALGEATRDPEFANVYSDALHLWHRHIVAILIDGRGSVDKERTSEIAWRLMALSSGLTGFSRVPSLHIGAAALETHIRAMLSLELKLERA